jgi:TonB family protein
MKVVLLESGARPSRRLGGGLASVVLHGALIGLALYATRATMGPKNAIAAEKTPITFLPPKPPPMAKILQPSAAAPSAAPAFAIPTMARISVPTIVPVGLPEINFEVAPMTDPTLYSGAGETRSTGPVSVVGAGNGTGTDGGGMWSGAELAMRLLVTPDKPRYPNQLRDSGVEGTVSFKFVVDTLGRIDPATIVVVESAHPQFTAAARATLDKLRFQPAVTVAGSKVRATAIMPFVFRITK